MVELLRGLRWNWVAAVGSDDEYGRQGLTSGLDLAAAARAMGFELMVGCMAGSSLSMAPAMVLAQQCAFVDLDGPLLQSVDWPDGLDYVGGMAQPPRPSFWGGVR